MSKRILIKLSGETLAGSDNKGIDFRSVLNICNEIKECALDDNQIAIVVGGGTFGEEELTKTWIVVQLIILAC